MSRIHLRSNSLVLWLSLSAAVAASALGVGCSSSSDSGTEPTGGKSGAGAPGTAGSGNEAGDPGESGEGGSQDMLPGVAGGSFGGGGNEETGGTSSVAGGSSVGDAGETGEGGSAGSSDPGPDPDPEPDPEIEAAKARALTLINSLSSVDKCTTCHQNDYSGSAFWPNITPDETTGIGGWTTDEIIAAIKDGKNKDGETLCSTMKRYTFTASQFSDLAIFLQNLPAVNHKITPKCPG